MDRFSAWLRAHGWTLLILLFLPLAGMALFPFAHSLLSSGKTPPVAMSDEDQLVLFVTGGCGLLLMGFLLLAYSRNRNARLRQESMERSLEYQKLITEATKGLYESIYEVDVTRDRADSEETRHYFERLGISGDTPFGEALRHIAATQLREEDRRGYLATFSPDRVLRAYREGVRSLRYEFMISEDGKNYYWLRIIARIFVLPFDQSVRMIVYRQNIDEEKKRECRLSAQARLDPLTGLCNKAATEQHISETLAACKAEDRRFAFFILDIDDFKRVNDDFGHAVGDMVIREFALELKRQFRDTDVAGRIGGDEFAAFLPVPGRAWVERKASKLGAALRKSFMSETYAFGITASIGIALAPRDGKDFATLYRNADAALYQAKKRGKDGFSVHAGA